MNVVEVKVSHISLTSLKVLLISIKALMTSLTVLMISLTVFIVIFCSTVLILKVIDHYF